MELTCALQHRSYDNTRPHTQNSTRGRHYISPPTHQVSGARKITLNDWQLHNTHLSTTGHKLRNDCITTAQKSHATSDQVRLRTLRNQSNTTDHLGQRISHVERAQDNLY